MHNGAEILKQKVLQQADQLKFFDFVWSHLLEDEKDWYRNNYLLRLPKKYE